MRAFEAVLIATLAGVTAPRAVHSVSVTGGDDSALTSGPITDLAAIAAAIDFDLVGRRVVLTDVTVERAGVLGFWVSTPHAADSIFIFPAERSLIAVRVGETISLQGEVRAMPEALRATLNPKYVWDAHLYVYAYMVRPAWPPLS